MNPKSYLIVGDGACSGNPGPGGWGLIVVTPSEQVLEAGDHETQTTNNRMEMTALYRGLQHVYRLSSASPAAIDRECKRVRAISDSKYVLDGISKFIHGWKRNGWKTSTGGDVKNQDLWEKISKGVDLLSALGFTFSYELVKGHAGHEGNERVDQIAVRYSKQDPIDLYHGPLSGYSIDIENSSPFKAVYLSLVDGRLQRHSTWDACKAATEGKRGSKYKKVTTLSQEKETLKTWGVNG